MDRGAREALQEHHLPPLPARDNTPLVVSTLEAEWQKEVDKKGTSRWLGWALLRQHSYDMWLTGFFAFLVTFSRCTQPIILLLLIQWIEDPDTARWGLTSNAYAYSLASLLSAWGLFQVIP
jgi:hypothetical protein